jgi:RNA polymerase sigma factor (TIGR02999 family)
MSEAARGPGAAAGDGRKAASELLPLVYDELRRLAAHKLANEAPGQTLQPTALVHEAWLRLVGSEDAKFENRGHFFAAAAEAMRRILVDNARRKHRLKRGGQQQRVSLDEIQLATQSDPAMLLTLDEALAKLEKHHPEKAVLVKLRYFAGLSLPEAAQALGLSLTTAKRHWSFARAWLYGELADEPPVAVTQEGSEQEKPNRSEN